MRHRDSRNAATSLLISLALTAGACAMGETTPFPDGSSTTDLQMVPPVDAGTCDGLMTHLAPEASHLDTGQSTTDASHDSGPMNGPDVPSRVDVPQSMPDVPSIVDSGPPPTDNSSCPASGFTGTLVSFDFTSLTGIAMTVPATSSATGTTAGPFGRSAGLTAVSGSAAINSSGWSTSCSADPTLYYTFTITPAAGCAVSLTGLSGTAHSSTTGPSMGAVGTSDDMFGSLASFGPNAAFNVTLSVSGATDAVEVRIYGFAATGTAGTMRLENTLTLTGSIE